MKHFLTTGLRTELTLKESHISMIAKVKLPSKLIDKLADLPEQGMGYQVVNVTLKNGKVLTDRRVVNSTYLLLLDKEHLTTADIENVELFKK